MSSEGADDSAESHNELFAWAFTRAMDIKEAVGELYQQHHGDSTVSD